MPDPGHEGVYLVRAEVNVVKCIDGLEVDRELVHPVLVGREDLMAVSIEGNEPVDIVPYFFVGCMEDMGAIAMVFDARLGIFFGEAVAADMSSFFDDEDAAIELAGDPFCQDRSEEAAACDHIGKGIQVDVLFQVLVKDFNRLTNQGSRLCR